MVVLETTGGMKMKTRSLGRSIMAASAVCIMFYILLALRQGQSTFDVGAGNLLFYAGIVTFPLGVILLLMGEVKHRR